MVICKTTVSLFNLNKKNYAWLLIDLGIFNEHYF